MHWRPFVKTRLVVAGLALAACTTLSQAPKPDRLAGFPERLLGRLPAGD